MGRDSDASGGSANGGNGEGNSNEGRGGGDGGGSGDGGYSSFGKVSKTGLNGLSSKTDMAGNKSASPGVDGDNNARNDSQAARDAAAKGGTMGKIAGALLGLATPVPGAGLALGAIGQQLGAAAAASKANPSLGGMPDSVASAISGTSVSKGSGTSAASSGSTGNNGKDTYNTSTWSPTLISSLRAEALNNTATAAFLESVNLSGPNASIKDSLNNHHANNVAKLQTHNAQVFGADRTAPVAPVGSAPLGVAGLTASSTTHNVTQ